MKWGRIGPSKARTEDAMTTSQAIFDVIKRIPGGAVERKIREVGEERVRDYWIRMRLYKTGDPRYRLPSKPERRHFWRPKIQNQNTVMGLEGAERETA